MVAIKKRELIGLIKLRKATAKVPTYECDNCKCKRYSKCTCMRKHKKGK